MDNLKARIDEAVAKQYPAGAPVPPAQDLLIKAHKKSARQRWVEHYLLQLRSHGFQVVTQNDYKQLIQSPNINVRTLVVQEFRFHPIRLWRFDFAIPAYRLGIEVDGGVWRPGGGAHSHPSNIMRDIEKSNHATVAGWHLLRFTDKEIRSSESIRMTKEFIEIASLRS